VCELFFGLCSKWMNEPRSLYICNNLCMYQASKLELWPFLTLLIDLKKSSLHKTQSVAIKSIRACEALVPGNLPSLLLHTFLSAIIGFFMRGKTTSWVGPPPFLKHM
jgi:hypothetical protein